MRLLNAHTLKLELFHDPAAQNIQYATLSHTWGEDEVSFGDMEDPAAAEKKLGFAKIRSACETTIAYGLSYVWVDTCCIDKSSSAELSEAINSMYRWYKNSVFCFAYLSDLPPNQAADQSALDKCRWFTRGWTLQELIAPKDVIFFDQDWKRIGTKSELKEVIANITRINHQILDGSRPLSSVAIAKRMSWASRRETTRVEDMAYSLLGIFDINMPMIYGEGPRAFMRLQGEILHATTDLSIFAWQAVGLEAHRGVFATSPAEFRDCGSIERNQDQFRFRDEISLTNRGIKIHTLIAHSDRGIFILDLHCSDMQSQASPERLGIELARELDTFYRASSGSLYRGSMKAAHGPRTIYLAPSDNALEPLSESRKLKIDLTMDAALRRLFIVKDIRAVPELFWDQRRECFSLPGFSNFLGFLRFHIAPGGTALLLVFNLVRGDDLRVEFLEERHFPSGYRNIINPFTNIEDYPPLGDPFSLFHACPKESTGRSSATHSSRNFRLRAELGMSDITHLAIKVRIEMLPADRSWYDRPWICGIKR
jgi:hypothetical protein